MWIALAAFVLWFLNMELGFFSSSKKTSEDELPDFEEPSMGTAEDADIRGHNFVKELQAALHNGDLVLAIHLRYLVTLQVLNNQKRIDWQPTKTPMRYVSELTVGKDLLNDITMAFLYIKYGHYPASQEVYDDVTEKYHSLCYPKEGGNDDDD